RQGLAGFAKQTEAFLALRAVHSEEKQPVQDSRGDQRVVVASLLSSFQRVDGVVQHHFVEAIKSVYYPAVQVGHLEQRTSAGIDIAGYRRPLLHLLLPAWLTQTGTRTGSYHLREYQWRFDDQVAQMRIAVGQVDHALRKSQNF